jgi:serine/threonine-protein kinase 24/25/MST4
MDTLRPVKVLDAAGSLRASQDYVGSNRVREAPTSIAPVTNERSPSKFRRRSNNASVNARAGKAIVTDVLVPSLQRFIKDDMDAREIEALSMISRGFEDLRDVNPGMAYDVVLDILSNLNE